MTAGEDAKLNGTPPMQQETSETPAPVSEKGWTPPTLHVRQDGKDVYARTSRTSYHAVIGQAYTPFGNTKDSAPKILLAVGKVGDEWQVSIGPADGSRGRTRGMQLASFLSRYIHGVSIKQRKVVKPVVAADGSRLARIERKLDMLLEQLGVKT